MADKYKSEMDLRDFVEAGVFEPGSRASEQVLQEDVDKAAERYDMVKGAKKALKRIKTKEKIDQFSRFAPAVPGLGGALGTTAGYFARMAKSNPDRLTQADQEKVNSISEVIGSGMKKGGSVMARGCKMGRKKKTKIY